MYPEIQLFGFHIYTFGICLFLAFLCFYYMLLKLSKKLELNSNFFVSHTLFFLFFSFFFSRILYIVKNWDDYSFLLDSFDIFGIIFPNDYGMTFIGAVFGTMFSLWYLLQKYQLKHERYIDALVLSFFFAAPVGYIGAFLGGQVYGIPTDSVFAFAITHEKSIIPFTSPIYPLALFYALGCFILFCIGYIARNIIMHHGFFGYGGLMVFSVCVFFGEFLNGGQDVLKSILSISVTQIGVCILFGISLVFFSKFLQKNEIESFTASDASDG